MDRCQIQALAEQYREALAEQIAEMRAEGHPPSLADAVEAAMKREAALLLEAHLRSVDFSGPP